MLAVAPLQLITTPGGATRSVRRASLLPLMCRLLDYIRNLLIIMTIASRRFPIHNPSMLRQVSKKGRKWAVCGTSDLRVDQAIREELKGAATWYREAVIDGLLQSEKAAGLALDDRGCVVPQVVILQRPKCKHWGWGGTGAVDPFFPRSPGRPKWAKCPQCKNILHVDTVAADREYFRDIANTTRSDHIEHGMSVEREFEVARWRALTVRAQADASRILWWNYPRLTQDNPWLGAKLYCLRHFNRALEVIEYQPDGDVLSTLKEIARNQQWWQDVCDRRALCHWPPIPFAPLHRPGSGRWIQGGLQRDATYFRLDGNWTGTRYVRLSTKVREYTRKRGQLLEGEEARPLADGWSWWWRSKHPPHKAVLIVEPFELDPLPYTDCGFQGEIARLKLLGFTFIDIARKMGLQESRLRLWVERWRDGDETELQLHCNGPARVSAQVAVAGLR
jgi:hypothetical protein